MAKRTTVMADPGTMASLRSLARQRGVSFARIAREALESKARGYRPEPTCLGSGGSGRDDLSSLAGVGRASPR